MQKAFHAAPSSDCRLRRCVWPGFALPCCLIGLSVLAGCRHTGSQTNRSGGGSAATSDPLFSSTLPPPKPLASTGLSQAPAGNGVTSPTLPPAPTSLTSNAALASATPAVLDRTNDLRISDPTRNPDSHYGQSPGGWSGAVLQKPEPMNGPQSAKAPAAPATSAPPATLEQARAQLQTRGVAWMRSDYLRDQDQWQFSCSIPNPHNPNVSRTYQATAHAELDAIRAVMGQIDKER
jgi:hypothetical protein